MRVKKEMKPVRAERDEDEGRVVEGSGWGKSGNEIRNVESRRERSGESHGGSVQKPTLNGNPRRRGKGERTMRGWKEGQGRMRRVGREESVGWWRRS
jgi:hypothetical protein